MSLPKLFAAFCALSLVAPAASGRPIGEAVPSAPIAVTQVMGNRFELVYAGKQFTSRDKIEARLLLRAAELTRQFRHNWFVLVQMPDEEPGQHLARTDVSYGPQYGHWQPHWYYFMQPHGWQPWHPEWEAPFWATETDPAQVEKFEVHAMIELRSGEVPQVAEVFDADAIVADLQPKLADLQP